MSNEELETIDQYFEIRNKGIDYELIPAGKLLKVIINIFFYWNFKKF